MQHLNQETEKFGGDVLLGGQEGLMRIRRQVEGWTDCALKVFMRHLGEDGSNYPDHDEMLTMNEVQQHCLLILQQPASVLTLTTMFSNTYYNVYQHLQLFNTTYN